MVLQLYGSKKWTTCIPRPTKLLPADVDIDSLSEADRCQLQEIQLKQQKGCTSYTDADAYGLPALHPACRRQPLHAQRRGTLCAHRSSGLGSSDHVARARRCQLDRCTGSWGVRVCRRARRRYCGSHGNNRQHGRQGLPLLHAFPMWTVRNSTGSSAGNTCRLPAGESDMDGACWTTLRSMYQERVALVQKQLVVTASTEESSESKPLASKKASDAPSRSVGR